MLKHLVATATLLALSGPARATVYDYYLGIKTVTHTVGSGGEIEEIEFYDSASQKTIATFTESSGDFQANYANEEVFRYEADPAHDSPSYGQHRYTGDLEVDGFSAESTAVNFYTGSVSPSPDSVDPYFLDDACGFAAVYEANAEDMVKDVAASELAQAIYGMAAVFLEQCDAGDSADMMNAVLQVNNEH